MAKARTVYFCTHCGNESAKWMGQCPSCGEWNTLREHTLSAKDSRSASQRLSSAPARPIRIIDIDSGDQQYHPSGDSELDRVLGGGIVDGALILLGGEPGVGKSTLLLQTALRHPKKTLYVSGEESPEQIKLRAERLADSDNPCFVLTETDIQRIVERAAELEPDYIVIDSIQTLHAAEIPSAAGSLTQVRECTARLQELAKREGIATFIIGHINKEGAIAGPKVLEHIVDVVLLIEGSKEYGYRLLRSQKNRFGSTDEIGVYSMRMEGMQIVENPSELLIRQSSEDLPGSAISVNVEGRRPLFIEAQALVSTSVYSAPQRSTTGYDLRRLHMMLAVLERRAGFRYSNQDVFLNITGGLKISDPGVDLAIAAALISALEDVVISSKLCMAGEIGLSGEVRAVRHIDTRVLEGDRLGYSRMLVPRSGYDTLKAHRTTMELIPIQRIDELYDIISYSS